MEITKNVAVLFLTLLLAESSWSLDEDTHKIAASQQNERDHQEPENTHTLSRVKRQFGYGYYGVPYYGLYRRPYPVPVPVPILIGGGGFVGRGFGGFAGRGFGGRGFGGRGFGGRGFGGRGFGGRGFGGRGIGGRGGFGGGRGGRG
ncbi:hypothetical protein ABMA27_014592 [Loxostege sticticalis]|uniref:Uncharacterized protein n=1 Tax=Loxostege sticticalis TaxID=481309 RepID=A0ABR3I9K2_LOXSC